MTGGGVGARQGGIVDDGAWRGVQTIQFSACEFRGVGHTNVEERCRSLGPEALARVFFCSLGTCSNGGLGRAGRRRRPTRPSGVAEQCSSFTAVPAIQAVQCVLNHLIAVLASSAARKGEAEHTFRKHL